MTLPVTLTMLKKAGSMAPQYGKATRLAVNEGGDGRLYITNSYGLGVITETNPLGQLFAAYNIKPEPGYYIADAGITPTIRDPRDRLADCMTGSAVELEIIAAMPCTTDGRQEEREMHELLRPWQIRRRQTEGAKLQESEEWLSMMLAFFADIWYSEGMETTAHSKNETAASAYEAYAEAAASAYEAYRKAIAPASRAHHEAVASASKAYRKAIAPASRAYYEAEASASKAYHGAIAPASTRTRL